MAHPITAPGDPSGVPLHFLPEARLGATESKDRMTHNAKSATDKEHKMTLLQGIKLYPKAIAWSVLISTCICMEGYDVCLLSSFCESSLL
jgi:SP family general alpha glucoside:H+ symporter-like MFS transporter